MSDSDPDFSVDGAGPLDHLASGRAAQETRPSSQEAGCQHVQHIIQLHRFAL